MCGELFVTFSIKRYALIGGIVFGAILISAGLSTMKAPPEAEPIGDIAILLEAKTLVSGDYDFSVESQGTVRPLTETILSAEVSGAVVSVSPKFVSGGVFAAGEELMRIDPVNYVGAVDQADALLKQRQIEFDGAKSLRTKGYRAEAEFAAADAALANAKAGLIRAKRDLTRTRIRLPYDGMVRSRAAAIGQFVNTGKELGVVFATDFAEVRLPLTDQDLAFVDLPDATEITESGVSANGPLVTLSAVQRGRIMTWQARVVRSEGVVDERTRVTYAVARIDDPYRLRSTTQNKSPLPMGTFVKASIDGATIVGAVRVPMGSLRRNNEIIFIDGDNRLRLETVDVMRTDAEFAYVNGSSIVGKRISVTAIESPINGMKVRTTDDVVVEGEESSQIASGAIEE